MQNDHRSHGLWEETAPALAVADTPPLTSPAEADAVIVGAGYTGLSAALHLAEAGRRIVVLEAAEVGFGASGRNVGLVNAGMWTLPDQMPKALGPLYGPRLLELLGSAPAEVFALIARHGIACEAVRNGTLHCGVGAAGLAELTERARQWRARGAPVELLDAAEAHRRIGGGSYAGALWDRRAGTLQPLAYARGLARAAMAAGATIHARSPVTGIAREGADWVARTPTGQVRAKWLVLATDAYTRQVATGLRREQIRLPYFNMATPPLPPDIRATILPGGEGCWDTRRVLSSFRLDADGRLVFGSVGQLAAPDFAVHRDWALRAMHRIFPQLRGIGFATHWFGWIGMTGDHLPRLHLPGENALAIAGYNGRGIAPGTVFGKAIAAHVAGDLPLEAMPLPVSRIAPAPLRRGRELFFRAGAVATHLVSDR
ncbi:NAD(P)/FAD-dependent oxidoreductase [Rhodovulum visakhapatnamense]|uniref:Glycine/D-amino acid oxidase-like deaminating enzyme n=1 Tax=Rhodovulum visakhapatnamense TaxID=364297 RepID=A0A4R8G6S5_9RHOB|nr:FAD-binding oxidoreductase [Rhodovulum visakhapatnamense]TDX31872.1 glycine/D-amino acid oxidase-like deaminating enzyme [Rhodovulum visakhapatnamense]